MTTYHVWLKMGTRCYIDADKVTQDEIWHFFYKGSEVVAQYPRKWIARISEAPGTPAPVMSQSASPSPSGRPTSDPA